MPRPRKLWIEERFALSNDDLKTKSKPAAWARCKHSRAIIIACSGVSITHGPAITVSRPSPNVALPTLNALTLLMNTREYTLSVLVSLIRGPGFSQLRNVYDQAARRGSQRRVTQGFNIRRAR